MGKRTETDLELGGVLIQLRYLWNLRFCLDLPSSSDQTSSDPDSLSRRDSKTYSVRCPLIIIKPHDCNVPANVAYAAHIIIMTLSFTICLSLMPPSTLEGLLFMF